jgi:prepilin-type N-terminal cleavage/methylation domain-containing protein
MSRKRGFSLLELMVALGIGAFILFVTGVALNDVSKIFRNTSGRDEALRDLLRARRALEPDLRQASLAQLSITPAPGSRGGGADGDCLDTLSAVNITTGQQASQTDGSGNPYLFQNLIYYVTTPTDHDSLFAASCVGGNEGGYDYNCPHKILVRLIADENPAYEPADSSTQDQLMPGLAALLTKPTGFPKSPTRNTVAIHLLSFRVRRQNNELVVNLQAVSIPDARRKVALGSTSMLNSPYTVTHEFSVYPRN